ncbi:hypothetical protein BgiMline_026853 [Biomphalaria glabrata]|uniref:Transmembrane protein 245-like isoform X2 n=1 Tax=Biomphalaria glabrata TaxID=6526 RepID=A0A9W2YAW7_BIOGL|nr:transmembrane protein 245-like isoform X2 [Biomphalaria glabrata]KAI8744293.1 transmembrane protein 245 [Biomphalaria glabrata]KAI8767866.1 transmembrane protein 245 [Biomphalaria glabrata]
MSSPSLEYLNNVWQYLPQGHEKPLKQAFYNAVANIFVGLAAAVAVAVYFILAPFIRPLYWALLCGNFLYPFKRSLTNVLRQWLKGLQTSGTPFAVGLILLPFQMGNTVAESMTVAIKTNFKVILGLLVAIPAIYTLYHFLPMHIMLYLLTGSFSIFCDIMEYFNTNWVWTFVIGYLICVVFMWNKVSGWIQYLSAPVWASVLFYLANLAGPLKVPFVILMFLLVMVGAFVQMNSSPVTDPKRKSICFRVLNTMGIGFIHPGHDIKSESMSDCAILQEGPVLEYNPELKPLLKPQSLTLAPSSAVDKSSKSKEGVSFKDEPDSIPPPPPVKSMVDRCFLALFWGHVIVRLWMHVWIVLLLLLVPLLNHAVKKIIHQFKRGGMFHGYVVNAKSAALKWFNARENVLLPQCMKGLASLYLKGDCKIISVLEKSLDQATSILFILMLVVGTFLVTIIGTVQVQRESMYMITSSQDILNKTVNSELSEWMPNAEEMKKTINQVLQKTHEHGRNFIASKVNEFLPVEGPQADRDVVVKQVLEVWDELYASMFSMNEKHSKGPVFPADMNSLWETISQGKNMLRISAIIEFAKANLGMLVSVMDSVWQILKGNLTLLITVVTSVLSALLGGGTAILNFLISAIIFLTTLFYLLASSGDMYKPAELFTNFSPGTTGSRFGQAVEKAISGVFKASLKMATFYGLYTWLVHLVFGLDVVFIPCVLAAVFAAIPFLGTYWAAVPAVIHLWLVQDKGLSALLLFVAHKLPSYVVDTAIYNEIEGGHPYVTGLAIAGGILFMGLEGAIIGPIILCCLIVVVNMYGNMLQSYPSTPAPVMWSKRLRSVSSDSLHVH